MSKKLIFLKGGVLFVGFVLFAFFRTNSATANLCQADINNNGKVDGGDLMIMRAEMDREDCYSSPCEADLNGDGKVNNLDIEILKAEHGRNDCLPRKENLPEENVDILQQEQDEGFEISEDEERDEVEKESVEEEIALPATRFVDNGNGTVTDPETGLVWTKDSNLPGDTMLFHQALTYIEEMNEGKHSNFGYTDWRLPTIEELRSLIDYTKLRSWTHEIPAGNPFQHVKSINFYGNNIGTCLTSTKFPLFISSYCRLVGHNVRSCYGYVWPVRGER